MKFLFIVVLIGLSVLSAGHRGPQRNTFVDGGRKPLRHRKSGHRSPSGDPSSANRGWGGGWSGNSGEGWNGGGWNNNPIHFTWDTFKCIDPTTIITTPNIDVDFFTRKRIWYFAGITKYGAAIQFRMFKGRDPKSQDEINQVCPTVIFNLQQPVIPVVRNGAGVQFLEECTGAAPFVCITSLDPSTFDGKLGANPAAGIAKQVSWMVATDNAAFAILYTCYDDVHADIQLFTTAPYVSPDLAKLYKDTAIRLGIPVTQLQLTVCKSRFTGWYPDHFQNYPNSPGNEGRTNGWNYHPAQHVLSNGWNNLDNGWNNLNNGWNNLDNGWNNLDNGWNNLDNGWNNLDNGWNNLNHGWSNEWFNGWEDDHGWLSVPGHQMSGWPNGWSNSDGGWPVPPQLQQNQGWSNSGSESNGWSSTFTPSNQGWSGGWRPPISPERSGDSDLGKGVQEYQKKDTYNQDDKEGNFEAETNEDKIFEIKTMSEEIVKHAPEMLAKPEIESGLIEEIAKSEMIVEEEKKIE